MFVAYTGSVRECVCRRLKYARDVRFPPLPPNNPVLLLLLLLLLLDGSSAKDLCHAQARTQRRRPRPVETLQNTTTGAHASSFRICAMCIIGAVKVLLLMLLLPLLLLLLLLPPPPPPNSLCVPQLPQDNPVSKEDGNRTRTELETFKCHKCHLQCTLR